MEAPIYIEGKTLIVRPFSSDAPIVFSLGDFTRGVIDEIHVGSDETRIVPPSPRIEPWSQREIRRQVRRERAFAWFGWILRPLGRWLLCEYTLPGRVPLRRRVGETIRKFVPLTVGSRANYHIDRVWIAVPPDVAVKDALVAADT